MAVAVKPSKSLLNIRSGIKSIKDSFSGLRKNTGNLNNVMLKKTKVKREAIARNYILSQRRQENERRKDREDFLEASSIGGVVKRQAKIVASSTKGFLGRIMDFLGTLLVGWLLTNLPSIITMAQELIARIQRLYTILTGFLSNTVSLFRGFGNLLGAVGENILTFDFTDSKGRVERAMGDLNGTFEDMQKQFDEGFKLLTTSLGEGVVSGEDAAPFGTQYENESMQEQPSAPTGGGNRASAGTKEQKAMLDTIAYAEGKTGYSTWFGFQRHGPEDLTNLTVKEVHDLQGTFLSSGKGNFSGGRSAAVGRYQFVPLLEHTKRFGRNPNTQKFTPQFQDELANFLAENRGVTKELLAKEGMSDNVIQKLSPEWASFPGNTYGQPTKGKSDLKNVYANSLGTTSIQTQPTPRAPRTPTPAQTSPSQAISTSVVDQFKGKPGGATGTITSERGMRWSPTSGKYKMHHGIDIAPLGPGYYVALKLSGTVDYIGWDAYGYGHFVDIKSGNTIYRFAHLAKVMVTRSQPYNGQTIGEIGSTGGSTGIHLHFEVRLGGGDSINPRPYLGLLSIGKQLTGLAGQPAQISTPGPIPSRPVIAPVPSRPAATPAQITPSGIQQRMQASQQLAQQPIKPSIVIIEEEPPSTPKSQVSVGSGGGMIIPIVINPLNSFITKKLLLDLAYT